MKRIFVFSLLLLLLMSCKQKELSSDVEAINIGYDNESVEFNLSPVYLETDNNKIAAEENVNIKIIPSSIDKKLFSYDTFLKNKDIGCLYIKDFKDDSSQAKYLNITEYPFSLKNLYKRISSFGNQKQIDLFFLLVNDENFDQAHGGKTLREWDPVGYKGFDGRLAFSESDPKALQASFFSIAAKAADLKNKKYGKCNGDNVSKILYTSNFIKSKVIENKSYDLFNSWREFQKICDKFCLNKIIRPKGVCGMDGKIFMPGTFYQSYYCQNNFKWIKL